MFCRHCGAKIDDTDEYCKYCGGSQLDGSTDSVMPFEDAGHSYHTPDPYEETSSQDSTSFDPFSEDDTLPHLASIDSSTAQQDSSREYSNPFDREIQDDLHDINTDEDVIASQNSGYMRTNGKNRTYEEPPKVDYEAMNKATRMMKRDNISEHDRTLAILTLVMAFVFPFAGIVLGRRFYRNVSHLTNPDPYYMRIAKWGLIISYVDVGIWAFTVVLTTIMTLVTVLS